MQTLATIADRTVCQCHGHSRWPRPSVRPLPVLAESLIGTIGGLLEDALLLLFAASQRRSVHRAAEARDVGRRRTAFRQRAVFNRDVGRIA